MAMAEMEDVPLVSEEKIPSNRRRLMMVVGAITFLMAMTLSITLGYVYFHKQHFRIRAGDPSHTKVGFPNQKDVQKLLELLQECHAFRQFSWQVAPKNLFSSFRMIPVISDTAQHVPVWSWCSPVQETYPDPQIVFNELKSLNVDNSDPENIKFTPKDWCLSCLGNLAILLHALGTGFRYFQIAFLGKTCWGFWNHTKSESWHESTWVNTGVQSLGQFLVPEEAVQRHTKITTTPVSKTPRPLWRALWCHKEHSKMDSYASKVTLLIAVILLRFICTVPGSI